MSGARDDGQERWRKRKPSIINRRGHKDNGGPENRVDIYLETTLKETDMNKRSQAISFFLPQIKRSRVFLIIVFLLTLTGSTVHSATFPSGFVSTQVATGLSNP